ncbi:phage Gp37/Gp68 family protein [Paracoccus yeei]|uniref:phage Gp37/Gp68 family protein n=1 Tax=Paracoccus yeei TaxID=147645 RepID=UPI003BF88F50
MAENSNIEWTHHTFNPWIGCQKVGPGCDHCYAETWDARGLQQRETRWGPHATRTRTSAANWRQPLKWDREAAAVGERRRVFCASLADVFDNHVSIQPEWRDDLWRLIEATPNLDWMLLTKRPGNIGNMLPVPFDFDRLYPNVWLGCTVVNQAEADRDIPKLLKVPAKVRFLSMEPLLGQVDPTALPYGETIGNAPTYQDALRGKLWMPAGSPSWPTDPRATVGDRTYVDLCGMIHLVIVGGESGPGARPMHPDWARALRDQCQAAGVAFHFKQNGEWVSVSEVEGPGDHFRFPDGATVRRTGKKLAGRTLDGRTWDEMPGVYA